MKKPKDQTPSGGKRKSPVPGKTPTKSPQTDKSIKGYSGLVKIAKGGMGEVYKAKHDVLNKEVILKKLIDRPQASFMERFKREATIMMEVSHPNIVHTYDYFKEGRSAYIAMEYIEGLDLARLMKKHGKLPVYLAAYLVFE
ncbi:MAG: protein kinase, partial [Spirochaetes bacterium]|nr:protein kinase [Spirochaetota bacterium]